jgi:hypothetical protein
MALAVSSTREAGTAQAPLLLLPALNAMFDITTTRTQAARLHPPLMIFAMLGALTLACSLFAGYDMAIRRRLNVLHSVAFAVVLSVTRVCDHRPRVPAPWIYPDKRLRPGARRSAQEHELARWIFHERASALRDCHILWYLIYKIQHIVV